MAGDYLWDRTGDADPEIQRLETLLAGYRYRAPKRRWHVREALILALAAGLAVAAFLAFRTVPGRASDWRIGGKAVAVGQTVETRGQAAKLVAQFVGEVELASNSRLQVLGQSGETQRLALRRGTLRALIWAPPSRFVVDTPSAKAIDLGCSYTLTVLEDDSGLLTVQTGWVAFQAGTVESFIPAGAACRTRAKAGPGLPYFEDASREFREAVGRFDTSGGREGVAGIVEASRRRDAVTLWHALTRTRGVDRELVVRRFAGLAPGVDRAGLEAGSGAALDQAWDSLGLGGAEWWRTWKHNWQ